MGQQPATLNCKVNENNQNHEVTHTKQFFLRKKRPIEPKEQSDTNNTNFPSENAIPPTSPRNELTRNTSQKNFSSKNSRQVTKIKTFIPDHQAITRVSQAAFKGSVKSKKFHVQEKSKTLAQIVESRYNTSKHFPYSQILGLTQNLAYSLAYMTKKKCNHHDFYPTNIYYCEGKFKIINPLELPCSGFYLTCQRQRFSFLSPELIIAILEQTAETDLGEECMSKSDVFAIGMILLEVCTLQPSSECFDQESYNIVDSVIKERLAKVVKVYTPVMAECINIMLQYQAEARVDPISLAQLVHWKIQNEKIIAMQMETPKQPQQVAGPQQVPLGVQGPPGKRMMAPPNLPPQQIRGPPPPPYMHQPFMMQNLNQNVIAVSLPNEQFTRIGPNNQGFLSSSSLQQKLRVIELIKQHPTQDDEEELHQQKLEETTQIEAEKEQLKIKQPAKTQIKNTFLQKQDPKPQYPFVESIYSQKPLAEINFESEKIPQPHIVRQVAAQNKSLASLQPEFNKVPLAREPPHIVHYQGNQNLNPYQLHEFNPQKLQTYAREEIRAPLVQGYDDRNIKASKNEQLKPKSPVNVYGDSSKQQVYNENSKQTVYAQIPKQSNYTFQAQKYAKSNTESIQFTPGSTGERIQIKLQQKGQFMPSHNYGTSTSKNLSTINNIYPVGQVPSPQTSFGHIEAQHGAQDSHQIYAKRYGTSFQSVPSSENPSQSIEQRVQRVLNMSRNAK